MSGTVEMPAGTARVAVKLRVAVPNNHSFYFDDVILRETTVASDAKDAADTARAKANARDRNRWDQRSFMAAALPRGATAGAERRALPR